MSRRLSPSIVVPLCLLLTGTGCSRTPEPPDVTAVPITREGEEAIDRRAPAREGEPLENTYWKLTRLGGNAVSGTPGQREPHLIINSETHRARGYGGCNGFGGEYRLEGDNIRLGPLAATQMACVQGMQNEQSFLQALDRVRRWRIDGTRLELLDQSGDAVAQFEAVHLN